MKAKTKKSTPLCDAFRSDPNSLETDAYQAMTFARTLEVRLASKTEEVKKLKLRVSQLNRALETV